MFHVAHAFQTVNPGAFRRGLLTCKINIQAKQLIGADKVMDVRAIPCSAKHPLIVQTWQDLPVGEHFILLNDHDPVGLHDQFTVQWPNTLNWQYLVKGPEEFRVKITKLKPLGEAAAPLSTSCGGH